MQLGFVSETSLRDALSQKLGLEPVDLAQPIVDPMALRILPRNSRIRYRIFPVALNRAERTFVVALTDTANLAALDQLRAHLKGDLAIEFRLAPGTPTSSAPSSTTTGASFSIDGILREIETGEVDAQQLPARGRRVFPAGRAAGPRRFSPTRLSGRASDVHFEPEQNFLRIRYRIDGVLRQIRSLHKTYWPPMAVRLKVMAKMDIAETARPRTGGCRRRSTGGPSTFASRALPTIARGEHRAAGARPAAG